MANDPASVGTKLISVAKKIDTGLDFCVWSKLLHIFQGDMQHSLYARLRNESIAELYRQVYCEAAEKPYWETAKK